MIGNCIYMGFCPISQCAGPQGVDTNGGVFDGEFDVLP